jgi:metal-responsive CopG/Arc/MetJ family transcriptional regulator
MTRMITITIDDEIVEELDNQATKEHRSRSNMLEVILREYLEGKLNDN